MELVNRTPLTASLVVSEVDPGGPRIGMLVAKATHRFQADGRTELETDEPFPLFDVDEETELGLLPRDDLPRNDRLLDVILLGAAYAPGGTTVQQQTVELAVGGERRQIQVFGDRVWEDIDAPTERRRISRAVPFDRMPLTWERAFGGSVDVLIDKDSPVTLAYPLNRAGRGANFEPDIQHVGETFKVPSGFPAYDRTRRLPNLESPDELIEHWDDAPRPVCWATVPMDSGLHAERFADVSEDSSGEPAMTVSERLWNRAHPDWVIELPPGEANVRLLGLTPERNTQFRLPALRVLADYVLGERTGIRELAPQTLVLLPEERRFYIVFRLLFNVEFQPEVERSFRLRTERGWYQPPRDES